MTTNKNLEIFFNQYEDIISSGLEYNHNEKEIFDAIYSKEFNNYLRKGVRPRLDELQHVVNFARERIAEKAVKQFYFQQNYNKKQTTNNDEFTGKAYIWRTENDSKVRSRHAERNGKTYIWGDDLNPGEDYGCRCRAEFLDGTLGRTKYDENGEAFLNELKDKERGLDTLRDNADKLEEEFYKNPDNKNKVYYGNSQCAKYTREAIKQAGFKIEKTEHAKDYGGKLEEVGFKEVINYEHNQEDGEENKKRGIGEFPKDYEPKKGDVIVFQDSPNHESGHMAMFDGKQWVSDFKQRDAWGGSARNNAPSYEVYRSDDW